MTTVERLRERARLIRDWERFELGMPAPDKLDYKDTANLMDRAADLLEAYHLDTAARNGR